MNGTRSTALALVDPSETLTLARLRHRLVYNCTEGRHYDAAEAHFEAAKKLLPDDPIDADRAAVDL